MFKIADGREHFYQWDLNRQIAVEDAAITELHFCNKTDNCSLVVEVKNGLANVPNVLLQTAWDIRVYGYTNEYTKVEKRFKVVARTKPSDYVYTETEVKNYGVLEEEILELKQRVYQTETGLRAVNDTAKDALSTADGAMNSAIGLRIRVDNIEFNIGNIENALNEITALQATYIGGAEE